MIAETGHFALVLALVVALVQTAVPLAGAQRRNAAWMAVAEPAAYVQFAACLLAFAMLTWAYAASDFSVLNVVQNSHSLKPMLYKITGVWGNHEGSMVLWVLILSLFGALVARFGGNLPPTLKARVLGVQGSIGVAFLLFILATSNPFWRVDPAPLDGNDLNPLLQDPGLAFHPPLLYVGYVGFSVTFAFAVAALLEGRVDAAWGRWVRPWTLLAFVALTLGIALGSWWAYYELGWGGWWFWDPVENASLMPWLIGAALLHSAIVVERRESLRTWTILLAILAFSLSLLGTFLVRSGILTSVHAFATDPARGVFILCILAFFVGGALALYAWRAPSLRSGGVFSPISREGGLLLNNLLLTTACATVFIGTLYPLALDMITGDTISVGPPWFNATFVPLIVPLLLAVPFGPLLAWKRGDLAGAAQRLYAAFALSLAAILIVFAVAERGPWLAAPAIGLGVFLVAGALAEFADRIRLFDQPRLALRRAAGLPRAAFGMTIAHAGVGVMVLGITGVSAWQTEAVQILKPGQSMSAAGYEFRLDGVEDVQGPNYIAQRGTFTVLRGGAPVWTMTPEKRFFPVQQTATSEVNIRTTILEDVYLVLGDRQQDGGFTVRAYVNPLVALIWIGALIMAIGGTVSLTDRRYRVGAPAAARARTAPAPLPAE